MHIEATQLENFVFESGLVSRKDLEEAKKTAETSGQKLDHVLVNRGILSISDLERARAYLLGYPFVNLRNHKFSLSVLSLIPEPVGRHHNIVALNKTSDGLEVGIIAADDLSSLEFVQELTGLRALPRLTDKESMKHALLTYQELLKMEFGHTIERSSQSLNGLSLVDALLGHALLQGATDIHIEPRETEVLVRYRVSGRLFDALVLPPMSAIALLVRIKSLAGLKVEENEVPQEGYFNVEKEKDKISFRVSIVPTLIGERITLHALRKNVKGFTLEGLGFSGAGLEHIYEVLHQSSGLVLVTGPESSGKTTTLYTLLDLINHPRVSIATIEDPIEYRMPRVNQTALRPEVGMTLLSSLRAHLRQDQDVIMVGKEMNKEEVSLALHSSGKSLILGVGEGVTAATTISRLLNAKVDSLTLASSLKVVIAQRLVKKLKTEKTKYFLNKKEIESLGKVVDLERMMGILRDEKIIGAKEGWDKIPFYKPIKENGFEGQIGIQEVLRVTPTIQHLIKNNGTAADFELTAKKEGMIILLEDGILKAVRGLTTLDEVLSTFS